MATSLLLLLTPFIQLGVSYYGSVATLMAVLCVILWRQPVMFSLLNWRTYARSMVLLGMFLSLASALSAHALQDVLRIAREGAIFLLMTALIEWFGRARAGALDPLVGRIAMALAVFFVFIALVQTVALRSRIYLGIPKSYFVQNDNTIPDQLDLLYSALRPNGTFGEPSYFAFILISLIVMFLPLARRLRSVRIMLMGLVIAGILSQSLAFLIALPLIAYFGYVRAATRTERLRIAALAAVLLAVFYIIGHDAMSARLQAGLFGRGDTSTSLRIVAPLSILWDFLQRHPLGVTFSTLPSVLQPFASKWGLLGADILMNGILNALFCYGIFGAVLIGVYLLSARDATMRVYLFVCASFNGALFAVDKFSIICLTASLYAASSAMARDPQISSTREAAFSLPSLRKLTQRHHPAQRGY